MKRIGLTGFARRAEFVLLALLLGVIYWFADAAVDASVFPRQPFLDAVLSPDADHLRMRLATAALLFLFGGLATALVAPGRRLEAELRASEGRLRSLIESSGDGILAYDTDVRVTLWNPAMEAISGIRAEELLG
jgi:PAS domain-containing protein